MFKDKLKSLIKPEEGNKNNKKKIENLVFFVIVLIITIVVINIIWNGDKKSSDEDIENTSLRSKQLAKQNTNANNTIETSSESTNELELKLEEILSKIQGVGEVNVFINYSESSEIIPMYNENTKTSNTQETDTSGGTRTIEESDSQKEIIYEENDGEKTPITQKVVEPKIEGAIITAQGAGNADVKSSIIQAVEAVTGLATHKIQVFELER